MPKVNIEQFAEIIAKYSLAIGGVLYPSQVEYLHSALEYWAEHKKIPWLDDVVVRLAFLMIVSDILYQEREERKQNKEQ